MGELEGAAMSSCPSRCGDELDGRYRLLEHVGGGSVGIVYRAERVLHPGRPVAVKLQPPEPPTGDGRAPFHREAAALGRLRHPHVVALIDFLIEGGREPYLVLEWLAGSPLQGLIARTGPLPLWRGLPILEAVAAALDHAHERGVVHRDVKPANVILDGDPAVRITLIDFGLAQIDGHGDPAPEEAAPLHSDAQRTQVGALVGTAAYMAPEIVAGAGATPASDIYSFAVLAYALFAGREPFLGTTEEVLAGHLHHPPPHPETFGVGLPPAVAAVLLGALAKERAQRPATARALVDALRAAGTAPPPPPPGPRHVLMLPCL